MALETSGFQLSQFDRAPDVPSNIGVVDTKRIYGAVVDALKTNEALRTTQQVQAATDAELALATQKAQTETGLLAPEAEARKAKAQLLTASAPYETGLLGPEAEMRRQKAALFSAQYPAELGLITPRAEAEAAKLAQEKSLATAKNSPEFISRLLEQQTAQGVRWIQDPNGNWMPVPTKLPGTIGATTTGAAPVATGSPIFAASGAIATPPSGLLARPTVTPAGTMPAGAPMTKSAVDLLKRQQASAITMGEKEHESFNRVTAKLLDDQSDNLFNKLPKSNQTIQELEQNTALVDKVIDDAIAKVYANSNVTGGGKPGQFIRNWISPNAAADFEGALKTIGANVGFDRLQKMRQDSPTGGALGNVSDTEGEQLRSTFGNLNTTLSPDQMVANLQQVKEARKGALERVTQAYNRDREAVEDRVLRITRQAFPNNPGAVNVYFTPEDVARIEARARSRATQDSAAGLSAESLFPAAGSMAPAQITIGEQPAAPATAAAPAAPEVAPGPHTAEPLVPAETPVAPPQTPQGITVTAVDGQSVIKKGGYTGSIGTSVPTAAPAQTPAEVPTATAAPQYKYPVYSVLGAAERLPFGTTGRFDIPTDAGVGAPSAERQFGEAAGELGKTIGRAASKVGQGIMTGEYVEPVSQPVPEPQYATPPAGKYSWEEYNARRRRAEEMGLPQAQLSPQGVGIANANLARYEAGQRAERGEPPVREITSSDGKRLTLSPENFDLITRFLAFLDTQPAPNLEPRMEVDREATRRLTEDRMRREELARQFRTMPRR